MMRNFTTGWDLIICVIFFVQSSGVAVGTTIIPFQNLGELGHRADLVVVARAAQTYEFKDGSSVFFRTDLTITHPIKGNLSVGDQVTTQKWEMRQGDEYRVMFGDLHFEQGRKYLLFLADQGDGLYHPICFSYYAFEEIVVDGTSIWKPSSYEHEFHLTTRKNIEPLYYYNADALVTHLKLVVMGLESWDAEKVKSKLGLVELRDHQKRESPAHCSFISSGSDSFRWLNFPQDPLPVHYEINGDPGCANAINYIRQAVASLNQAYDGINLTDGGTFSGYSPSCGSGAQGSNLPSFVQAQWGESRHILVQFDDPCNAIPDLANCSGTLAVGGLYGVGSHIYDGENWLTGAYGYVVVNNGVGACMCSTNSYGVMMIHELSHTLGIGHISSSSGTANMNPSCCNPIAALDLACVNYTYESSTVLPVDLLSFDAKQRGGHNEITWKATNEIDVAEYVLERATDDQLSTYESIGSLVPIEKEMPVKTYIEIDPQPFLTSFYRLKVIDLDGSVQYSNIVSVDRPVEKDIRIYPTTTRSSFYIALNESTEKAEIQVLRADGQQVMSADLSTGISEHNIHDLPSGLYLISIAFEGRVETFKITKW